VVTAGLAAALLSTGAIAAASSGGSASAETLTFAVDALTSSASTEQSKTEMQDVARVAADRSATNAQRAAAAARNAEVEKARAAKLAKQRKEAAERAARAAQRQRIIANAQEDPKAVARMLLPEFGYSDAQWPCLDQLWIGESDWRWWVENPSSGAYGIPQSLPGRKMATMGSDWRTNPVTQIRWGLDYIKKSYGTPCNALDVWQSRSPHWY
jgi:murein DD-endopeptidase MepM/ murein hydrolase activator NlpD